MEEQRFAGAGVFGVRDSSHDDRVVSAEVDGLDAADQAGDGAIDSGRPSGVPRSVTPANLLPPDRATARARALGWMARMSTANRPLAQIFGHVVDDVAGRNRIKGGPRDKEMNELTAIPRGPSSAVPVTTATPVTQWPQTWRSTVGRHESAWSQ